MDLDRVPRHPLPFDLGDCCDGKLLRDAGDPNERVDAKRLVDPLRALRGDVGEAHAVGGEQR